MNIIQFFNKEYWKTTLLLPFTLTIQTAQWNFANINQNDNKCQNKPNGIYRDEMDCRSFYVCESALSWTALRLTQRCPEPCKAKQSL